MMEALYSLCDRFSEFSVSSQWRSLLDLYLLIEKETTSFQQTYGVACPPGCGTCCEHFVPELTELEASLIGAYLLFVKQDPSVLARLDAYEASSGTCPLYNPDSPYHCTVYPVRGMICRLFGACPSEDKFGNPIFRKCKYNTDVQSPVLLDAKDFGTGAAAVTTMRKLSVQFSALEPLAATLPITDAVLRSLSRLQFIAAHMGSDSHDDDNGGSDPLVPTPTPLAS
ncbi:MAG: YkgJ family cysteine cluster protein [Sphaerochaetaceae bacterium]